MRLRWASLRELIAERQQTHDEHLRLAQTQVIKDRLWRIQKMTYDFIHTMIEYEFTLFTEHDEKAFLTHMLNRFPRQ